MRTKESAPDYRYFPDPDLPPFAIDTKWIDAVRAAMPELPVRDASRRYKDVARALRLRRARADHGSRRRRLFRGVRRALGGREGRRELDHERALRPHEGRRRHHHRSRCGPVHIAELIELVQSGTLNVRSAPRSPREAVRKPAPRGRDHPGARARPGLRPLRARRHHEARARREPEGRRRPQGRQAEGRGRDPRLRDARDEGPREPALLNEILEELLKG